MAELAAHLEPGRGTRSAHAGAVQTRARTRSALARMRQAITLGFGVVVQARTRVGDGCDRAARSPSARDLAKFFRV